MSPDILEIKETLSGERRPYACTLVDRSPGCLVIRYVVPRDIFLGGVEIPAGTFSFGYFWLARHYNAYHFVTPQGQTLGLYCNVADRLRLQETSVSWRDLVVDVLILPDGSGRILDEDELPLSLPETSAIFILRTAEKLMAERKQLLSELEHRTAGYL